MDEMIIAMATAVILQAVKSPAKRRALDKSMYKIWKTIGSAFPHFKQRLEAEAKASD